MSRFTREMVNATCEAVLDGWREDRVVGLVSFRTKHLDWHWYIDERRQGAADDRDAAFASLYERL